MKTIVYSLFLCCVILLISCEKEDSSALGGSQSPMGEVGATVGSTLGTVAGVSDIEGTVTSLDGGVSSYTGTAVITNATIKNILSNFPGTEVNGDNVTITDLQFKNTTAGVEAVSGLSKGIIVKYDASVGDTYNTADGTRTVISRSTDDDFAYGFMLIKVVQVEENINKFGVKKILYWANHRFGPVAIEFTFDDNSTARFPIYWSAENE